MTCGKLVTVKERDSTRNSLLGGTQSLRPETVDGFILARERVLRRRNYAKLVTVKELI